MGDVENYLGKPDGHEKKRTTESREARRIEMENRVHLQYAAAALREVLPGYGIGADELRRVTKPLAEAIRRMLETEC